MTNLYSKPPLLLINDSKVSKHTNIFYIASSYKASAKLIQKQFDETKGVAFVFPSIVCEAFAIELFLKFFIYFAAEKNNTISNIPKRLGHNYSKLWNAIPSEFQELISSHYANAPKPPSILGRFEDSLNAIGNDSFEKWRYAYEIETYDFIHMDHTKLVSDVLFSAANFGVMKLECKQI